jgi:hypothetical protein
VGLKLPTAPKSCRSANHTPRLRGDRPRQGQALPFAPACSISNPVRCFTIAGVPTVDPHDGEVVPCRSEVARWGWEKTDSANFRACRGRADLNPLGRACEVPCLAHLREALDRAPRPRNRQRRETQPRSAMAQAPLRPEEMTDDRWRLVYGHVGVMCHGRLDDRVVDVQKIEQASVRPSCGCYTLLWRSKLQRRRRLPVMCQVRTSPVLRFQPHRRAQSSQIISAAPEISAAYRIRGYPDVCSDWVRVASPESARSVQASGLR